VYTEEEISTMKKELDKYGIQMPSFGKIGGILTNEVSICYQHSSIPIIAVSANFYSGPHCIHCPIRLNKLCTATIMNYVYCPQMSVDEAAMHAAIMAVNEALDKESSAETLAALRNPNTCLVKVEGDNAERYQGILIKAKRDKASKAQVL
jgi:hypothetical protein